MGQEGNLRAVRLEQVADGVFAYLQPDGGWCVNNAGLIVADGQTMLVDTAATEARARHLRQTVRSVAPAAPALIVNTHSHGDHTFGNFVFPEAAVIGHERARDEMLTARLHLTGLWPDVDWGNLRLVPPRIVFPDRLTLHVGEQRVELLHLGPAHTCGDVVVWLPDSRVLFTIAYIAITLRSGRTPAQKQALHRRIAELAHAYAGTEPRNVFVVLTENGSADWSLGEGVAQYLDQGS